jgi:acetylornithine/succinyldiaminopimelate/putrescine aminotransferase
MSTGHPLFDTWDQIIQEQLPNFLRLYVNPFVARTCLALNRYVQDAWHRDERPRPRYPSFLANSFDEALSGAIKLARYAAALERRPKTGLVIDGGGRLGPLSAVRLEGKGKVEFIPEITVIGRESLDDAAPWKAKDPFGFVVLFPGAGPEAERALQVLDARRRNFDPLVIACVDRTGLRCCHIDQASPWHRARPDIVVFDESFVRKHAPFGAFAARESLYRHWTRRGKTTFHSTTYQPNTISSLLFLKCLERDDPEFFTQLAEQFERVARDPVYRKFVFAELYNASLARATTAVGWDTPRIQAAGHYITVNGKQVFDAVAGVACSIRGHNPVGYRQEIEKLAGLRDYQQAATECLRRLTGLGGLIPAVSGAAAVENALRVGLVAQFPRKYVLALKGGFGGKTLLALTGTANHAYKTHLDPLYPHVLYVDPFRESALEDLDAAFQKHPIAVVQMELIQAVGGVRPVPAKIVQHLEANKRRWGYLLFVDEVQTGMYRTGPFLRSTELGIQPDLVTIGKGTSDMMLPFAVTLYGERVREPLEALNSDLPDILRQRFDYEYGFKTLLNVLNRAAEAEVSERVREAGASFAKILRDRLSACKVVRDIRVFGLLIAIELDVRRWPLRWFKKQAGSLYAMNLLRHEPFPVLVGFCQYEPHVLKFTPPLSITKEEIERVCDAIGAVMHRPAHQLLRSFMGTLAGTYVKARRESRRHGRENHECLEC